MTDNLKNTWESYMLAWNTENLAGKRSLFEKSLAPACRYTDPLRKTEGWDELQAYMRDFHAQMPGCCFKTYYFLDHHQKSIAKWQLKNNDGTVLSEGISYGEYNADGLLIAMSFFEAEPPAT